MLEFFRKLRNGEFSLAKTFWLYGVCCNFFLYLLMEGFFSEAGILAVSAIVGGVGFLIIACVMDIFYILYNTNYTLGVWRAVDNYTGRSVWAVLAKIHAVLCAIVLTVHTFVFIGNIKNLFV